MQTSTDKHYGQAIERIIRRNGYSISELARLTNVNRRSIYNWFNQRNLKPEIIFRIGCALKHDFSEEFPELFSEDDFEKVLGTSKDSGNSEEQPLEENSSAYWKDKYIRILEEYNRLLVNQIRHDSRKS
ncbi:helix-turn-helix transcriptional regulator [Olivibacter sp. SDN3]|uniref:helix-turn-helix domain-containing protein n=1 Tax=Olivibacter sp. SDN3 TaxID=2764720 RepID=UPI001650FEE5|nr:helix-turn-helix transcriptional regulator [Olivibacter sp. SDN3]QNL52042.1 helix-turn-helix transcriptional regulator [Olivibacter sp. SDN3]